MHTSEVSVDVPAAIFRQYDIRGVVDEQLTAPLAHAVARALVTLARKAIGRDPRIAVGRDNRPSGDLLARAVRDGVARAGGVAVDIGILPTPAHYLALHELEVDGGIQVTGSHNPPEFNGFKLGAGGETLHGERIQELRRLIEEDRLDQGEGGIEADDTVLRRYADAVASRNGPIARPVKVVVDCGNGVAGLSAEPVLSRIGANVVPLFCDSDGTFPNHHPDPAKTENFSKLGQNRANCA
jgi:phosphomannomutase/phosphoglucomutase